MLKLILAVFKFKKFIPERLVGAGGMPSSHTALVVSVALAAARIEGISSTEFGISMVLAAIVIYDAMGVRRAAGEHAKVINEMIFSFKDIDKIFDYLDEEIEEEFDQNTEKITEHPELKEFLGHTPLEVLGGALVGIIVSSAMPV